MATTTPVLDGLNLIVGSVDAAVAFYRTLGIDIPDASVWRTPTGAHHVDLKLANGFSLDLDSPALAKQYHAGWRPAHGDGVRLVIGFKVASRDAVEECHARMLAAGYACVQPPYDTFWGARYTIIEDPDGNHVGVMSPPEPSRRSRPPDI